MTDTTQVSDEQLIELMEEHGSNVHIARVLGWGETSVRRIVSERGLKERMMEARRRYIGPRRGAAPPPQIDIDKIVTYYTNTGCNAQTTADLLGIRRATLRSHMRALPELGARMEKAKSEFLRSRSDQREQDGISLSVLEAEIHKVLQKHESFTIESLSDKVDASPKRVREALNLLRIKGYRIPDEDEQRVVLQRMVPERDDVLHKSLLEGARFQVGVVSDTHLGSKEEALPELRLAYDIFEEKGITEVWHAGDLTCGYGIFPNQAMGVKYHTFEDQVNYATDVYPFKPGIRTRMISGNHDVEGAFGKLGANPVVGVAKDRPDIDFLGDYSAWIELPGGALVHLLHGKGGGGYAFSYQAQKLVDSYPSGRKPAVLIVGHFHRKGNIEARGVEVMWPACFEWKSSFLARIGLTPAVGFYILDMTIGEDGTLVQFLPRWYRFFEGRVVDATVG